jgi:hypothetical protein
MRKNKQYTSWPGYEQYKKKKKEREKINYKERRRAHIN